MISGCSSDDPENTLTEPPTPISLTETERATMNQLKDFDITFTADVCKFLDVSSEGTNMVCSPLGAEMLFSLISNGMSPADRPGILAYLGVDNQENLNALNRTLINKLPSRDKNTKIRINNSLWVNSDFGGILTPEFQTTVTDIYACEISNLSFGSDPAETVRQINNWIAAKTNGIENSYFIRINTEVFAVALNTLYFKAIWSKNIFKKENTHKAIFHGLHHEAEVDMMKSRVIDDQYAEDEFFHYFTLDLGNQAFGMTILYPKDNVSMDQALEALTPERVKNLKENLNTAFLHIEMPRFALETSLDLNNLFSTFNIDSFNKSFTFSMFTPNREGTITFSQGASLTINEEGAEASATTSGAGALIADIHQDINLTLDHPFFFFIREYSTGTTVLSGRVANL